MKKMLIGLALAGIAVPVFANEDKVKILEWSCANTIAGVAQNTSKTDLSYVALQIPLYKNDVKVGDAIANVSGIDAGGKWAFKAITFLKDFDKCGAPRITAF